MIYRERRTADVATGTHCIITNVYYKNNTIISCYNRNKRKLIKYYIKRSNYIDFTNKGKINSPMLQVDSAKMKTGTDKK